MIADGRFREDLYYRLAEIVVKIPSLAERPGDAVASRQAISSTASPREMNPQRQGLSPDALAAIDAWPWPGNVRELENRMKRAVIMADGKSVTAEDLDLGDGPKARGRSRSTSSRARAGRPQGDPPGAEPHRRQYLRRRQAARDQPADAVRPAQAVSAAGVGAFSTNGFAR